MRTRSSSAAPRTPLRSLFISICLSLLIGVAGTWFVLAHFVYAAVPSTHSLRITDSDYPLLSPLLLCNVSDQKSPNENTALAGVINKYVQQQTTAGVVDDMSVYVIDYQNGKWAGFNENARYDPASMLKVPVMIAFYQAAEREPSVLDEKIKFNGDAQNDNEYFKSPNGIQSGTYYTTDQMIKSMITNSDNTAALLLEKDLNPNTLSEVFTDLGLPVPEQGQNVQYLSTKLYAYFFRVLYSATYLNREFSQKALSLLSQTTFAVGIKAGVPAGTTVADKFGERSVYDTDGALQSRELHDCGIVYKPGSPYLICVMSRSKATSFDAMAKNIADMSALVYQNIQ
jgi:beta-lactamase class A